MSNGSLQFKRFLAYCDDPEAADINAALAAVSGQYANFFFDPLIFSDDEDPVDPDTGEITGIVRSWGNGGPTLVRRDEQRALKDATSDFSTIAFREEAAYGQRLIADAYERFIAGGQLRRNGDYVRASGVFKTSGTVSQSLTNDFALMICWDRESNMLNCIRSGDGNRIQMPYDGTYFQEVKFSWDCDVAIEMQGVVNTTFTGRIEAFPSGPGDIAVNDLAVFSDLDKWGIAVRATGDLGTFTMKQGSWIGVDRVSADTTELEPASAFIRRMDLAEAVSV